MGEKPGRITTFVPNRFPETGIGSDMRTGKGTETRFSPLPFFLHGACASPHGPFARGGLSRCETRSRISIGRFRSDSSTGRDAAVCFSVFSGRETGRNDRAVFRKIFDAPAELSFRAKGAVLFPKRKGADRSGATARPECPRKWRITFRCMRSLPSLRRRKGRSWNAGAMGRERLLSKIGMTAGMAFLAGVRDVRTAAGTVFRRFAVCPSCERIFLAGQGGADRRWHGVSVCWRRTPAARRGGGFPERRWNFRWMRGAMSGRGPQFRTVFPEPVPVFRRGRFERCRSGTEKDAAKGFVSAPEARLP